MRETWVQSLGLEDPWRRKRLPTPVFWPGESHGLYSPRGLKESVTTECVSLRRKGTKSLSSGEFKYLREAGKGINLQKHRGRKETQLQLTADSQGSVKKHWVGQKVHSGFSSHLTEKLKRIFLAKPIHYRKLPGLKRQHCRG